MSKSKTVSCQPCNQKKSDQTAAEFGYPEVEKQAKAPLKDAAAVCVGKSTPETLKINGMQPLKIKAMGHGQRQMCDVDKYGFRRKKKDGTFTSPKTVKRVHGFQTGDMIKAAVPKGKSQGTHIGRLASVRANGNFTIQTKSGQVGKTHKYCQVIQHADGYNYTIGNAIFDLKSA